MQLLRTRGLFKIIVTYLLSFIMVFVPFTTFADPNKEALKSAAQEAQSIGETSSGSFVDSIGDISGSNFSVPTVKDGTFTVEDDAESIDINELYPGTNPNYSGDKSDYFSGGTPTTDQLESINSDEDMSEIGNDARRFLYQDATSDDPSVPGIAYQVVIDANNRSRPDMREDPIFDQTRDVMDDIDLIAEEFADCSTETNYFDQPITSHIPDFQNCTRIVKPKGGCQIFHNIVIEAKDVDIAFIIDATGSMDTQIKSLRDNVRSFVKLLTNQGGKVRIGGVSFKNGTSFQVKGLSDDIESFRSWVSGLRADGADEYIFHAINYAQDNFSWRDNAEKVMILIGNAEAYGSPSIGSGALSELGAKTYVFHDVGSVKNLGQHISNSFNGAKLLKIAQFLVIVQDEWTPQECIADALSAQAEFCEGDLTAVPAASPKCTTISGFEVCEGEPIYEQLSGSPVPGFSKMTARIDVGNLICDYNQGTGSCWYDAQGQKQCLENNGADNYEQCAKLEENTECGYIKSECTGNATGSDGRCYVWTDTYDCGYDVEVPSYGAETSYSCPGAISCLGDECISVNKSQSKDFARVAGLLQAAQGMANDMNCIGPDGKPGLDCEVFGGEPAECKIAVGGMQDCCETPDGVSLSDYLTVASTINKIDSALITAAKDSSSMLNQTGSLYKNLTRTGSGELKVIGDITKPITNSIDALKGEVTKAFEPVTNAFNEFAQKMANETAQFMTETFGAEAANAVYGEGTATAGEAGADATFNGVQTEAAQTPLANAAGAVLQTVMLIYTIYTVTKLIISIVWACEEEELELGVKRELKSAVYIGSYCASKFHGVCIEKRESYCTFNSPLSRILQQEVRKQIGTNFGSAKNPECSGFTLEQLQDVDWDKVNLDEWLGIAMANGLNMNPAEAGFDKLTGTGSTLSTGSNPRLDTIERTTLRLNESNPDDVRVNITESMAGNTDHQTGTNPRVDEIRARLVEIDQELYAINQKIEQLEEALVPQNSLLQKLLDELVYIQKMKIAHTDNLDRINNDLKSAREGLANANTGWSNAWTAFEISCMNEGGGGIIKSVRSTLADCDILQRQISYWEGQQDYFIAQIQSLDQEKQLLEQNIAYWTSRETEKLSEIALVRKEIAKIEAGLNKLNTDKSILQAEKERLEEELKKYLG